MRFEFGTTQRIVFGSGTIKEAGPIARAFGRNALVVTGRNPARAHALMEQLRAAGVACDTYSVDGEPTTEVVSAAAAKARSQGTDVVIGFGGGSAIDAAKAISVLAVNEGELLDHLEVIGKGLPLSKPGLPCLAVPTTAGAGAEVTRNSVLLSPQHRLKVSLRSPHILPRVALVDPELTYSLPPEVTAATGLDALTQLIEPFVALRSNPITDALCREGIHRAARALPRVVRNGRDIAAREDMALASLLGGIALANAGLGAAHGFAAPIGGRYRSPHGAVCAALLPHATSANIRALRERAPDSSALRKYQEIAVALTGDPSATPEAGAQWLENLVTTLRIPLLRTYGLSIADAQSIVAAAAASSSMKGNPIALTAAELGAIYSASV